MIVLTLAEVASATGGRLAGGATGEDRVTADVVTDSRQVAPGCLFAALPGARADGHDFAAAALAAGAVAVLAARDVGGPAVVVDDPLLALGRLARAVVDRLPDLTVVGVTGSSGKTSTKDLLAVLLRDAGPTVAPLGSFNNELGLPLTALRVREDTRFLVAEMGARGIGHISYLCEITPPRIAVVLNVGAAHAGVFGSREVTARAKGELVEALGPDGVAILNDDDPAVATMASRTGARVVRFGRGGWGSIGHLGRGDAPPRVAAVGVRLDGEARASFRLVTPDGEADVALRLHGEHHVGNALAAAAVGITIGLTPSRVAGLLSLAGPASRWRMDVRRRDDGVTVVNDAYNANPDSVRAALDALVAMSGAAGTRRRTWAVLGEMLELGESSAKEHHAVGAYAAELGVDTVVAVGGDAGQEIASGAGGRAVRVTGADAALDHLRERVAPGDVVLVKASRSVGLETVAERLLADDGTSGSRGIVGNGASA